MRTTPTIEAEKPHNQGAVPVWSDDSLRSALLDRQSKLRITTNSLAYEIGCSQSKLQTFLDGDYAMPILRSAMKRYLQKIGMEPPAVVASNGHAARVVEAVEAAVEPEKETEPEPEPTDLADVEPQREAEAEPEPEFADEPESEAAQEQRLEELASGFTLDLTGAIDLGVDEDPVRAALFNAFAIINDEYESVGDERALADQTAAELATRHTRLHEQREALEQAYRVICNYTSQRTVSAEMAHRGKF